MGQIIILGSGYAIPEEGHDNAHLFVQQASHGILIDCASNPIVALRKAAIDPDQIDDLILTHFHPDHVSGMPLMLMDMWLLGRRKPLHIFGLPYTIDRAEAMMKLYDWKKWPNFFQVIYNRMPEEEMSLAISRPDLKVYTSPVKHLIPTIGIRVDFVPQEKSAAYSCDTEPCPQVVRLGSGVDVLIHEATGAGLGHSSAGQAAQIARQAGAHKLVLIHYNSLKSAETLEAAQQIFTGPTVLAEDFMRLEM